MSIFAQLLRGNHGLTHLIGYGMFISVSHLLWFLLISLFCSTPVIQNKILRKQVSINRVIGIVLATLGFAYFSQTKYELYRLCCTNLSLKAYSTI
jgi:threonine/homoserine/homoserine lactone efflux protein